MKEALSLITFCIGALCFVVFVTVCKPTPVNVVSGASKPEYCNREASPTHRCPLHVFAAVSGTNLGQ